MWEGGGGEAAVPRVGRPGVCKFFVVISSLYAAVVFRYFSSWCVKNDSLSVSVLPLVLVFSVRVYIYVCLLMFLYVRGVLRWRFTLNFMRLLP